MNHEASNGHVEKIYTDVDGDSITEEFEINLEDIEPPVPPDGGWGWIILLGSFVCMFCVDGLSFSFGVMLSDLQTTFECSTTTISLAGSLIVGFTLISGPIVSAVSNIVSFRTLVMLGSAISFFSLLMCAFAYDVKTFIILFGFVTGTCYGMIYLPAATIVSQWFAKRRATATGISFCGSSIGTAIYSAFLPKLIKMYSWRGCMAIMAAISLHCFAAGCLFIPLREYQRRHPPERDPPICTDFEKKSQDESIDTSETAIVREGVERARRQPPLVSNSGSVAESGYLRHDANPTKTAEPVAVEHPIRSPTHPLSEEQVEAQSVHISHDLIRIQGSDKHPPPIIAISAVNRVVDDVLQHQSNTNINKVLKRKRCLSVEPIAGASVYVKHDQSHGKDLLFTSTISLKPYMEAGAHIDPRVRREIVQKLQRELDVPASRKDFFYTGSMVHVKEYVSSSNINEYVRSVTKVGIEEIVEEVNEIDETSGHKIHSNRAIRMLSELFDISLFRSPTFIVILASSVFGLLGYPVPYVFLADEARTLGFSTESSANLLVYLSVVNTVGRVAAGVISDWSCTDALFINNAALITSGAALMLLPTLTTYMGHVFFSVTFGFAIAAFVSLRIILLVETLGLERLTNAFGFLLLFQGLAFMVSPPLLAAFYDFTKNYWYTFFLGGASLILSGVMCFPLRQILRFEKKRRGEIVDPRDSGFLFRFVRRVRDLFRE